MQTLILLIASYIFYGWWDPKALFLILSCTATGYFIGTLLGRCARPKFRIILLLTSVFWNLGILAFFKYFNFFVENFQEAFTLFGVSPTGPSLEIVLPVGISFFTFQTIGYTIDVYRKRILASHDPLSFFTFICFFPQLVAGPIERASHLLPQFTNPRKFSYPTAVAGMRLILAGLFKKIVIADQCAPIVTTSFADPTALSGNALVIAAILFAFQIYCDFSGYSDIAVGSARLFGFSLMRNFATPYFSRDLVEFWHRWHISLSTWFRDYIYIPLGGNRLGWARTHFNILFVFLLSGFWHGANWTFLVWGIVHGIFYLASRALFPIHTGQRPEDSSDRPYGLFDWFRVMLTFSIVTLAWIFFRSNSVSDSLIYLDHIFVSNYLAHPGQILLLPKQILLHQCFPFIFGFLLIEWFSRRADCILSPADRINSRPLRWFIYTIITYTIIWHSGAPAEFIYFAF